MSFFKTAKLAQYRARQWLRAMFVYPKSTLSASALTYDDYWDEKRPRGEHIELSPAERDRADIISAVIPQGAVVIGDIGSGPGVVLKAILDQHPDARGIAYDSSARALEEVRALGMRGEPLDLTRPRSLEGVEPCDYYLVLEVLEHVPNSEEILGTLLQKSARGVFFSIPNTGFLTHRFRLLFGRVPAQWIHMPNEHLRFWTTRDMRWWLTAQGYAHFTITPYRGIPFLNRILPNLCAEGMVVFVPKKA